MGYGQHGWANIEPDHLPCRAHHGGDVPRHNACAARHVQHTLASLRSRVLKERACPGDEECRAKISLVHFGRIRTLLFAHGVLLSEDFERAKTTASPIRGMGTWSRTITRLFGPPGAGSTVGS